MNNAIQDGMPQFCSVLIENQSQKASQTPQDGPRGSKKRTETAQDAPKTFPKRPQDAPKWSPSRPRCRDMHPAGTRAAPTRAQKHARDASRSLRALILARFWKVFFSCTHFQMIFIDTWFPFASKNDSNSWKIAGQFQLNSQPWKAYLLLKIHSFYNIFGVFQLF